MVVIYLLHWSYIPGFLEPNSILFLTWFGDWNSLVTLIDYLCLESNRESVFLLACLDHLPVLYIIDHYNILLENMSWLEMGTPPFQWFC